MARQKRCMFAMTCNAGVSPGVVELVTTYVCYGPLEEATGIVVAVAIVLTMVLALALGEEPVHAAHGDFGDQSWTWMTLER